MKLLRILTGLHAGSQIVLKRRRYLIGRIDGADIQLTDWPHDPVNLVLDEGDNAMLVALTQEGTPGDPARPMSRLADFVPVQFKSVVLCAGPAAEKWPSDVALMSRLLSGKGAAPKAPRMGGKALFSGALTCAALLIGFTSLALRAANGGESSAGGTGAKALQTLPEMVRQALASAGSGALLVREAQNQVVVEGLLPDSAAVARTRSALAGFGNGRIVHKYVATSELVQAIADALNNPALQVSYQGQGVFSVAGQVRGHEQLRDSVQRIAADLGPLVTRIDTRLTEPASIQKTRGGAMLDSGGMQYVQTGDGMKHLEVFTPADTVEEALP